MGAAYEATGCLTDDESFGFTMELKAASGGAAALSGYSFEYVLEGCGAKLALNEANGITVDDANDIIVVAAAPDYRLRAGQYRHGFRMTQISTGFVTQLFDGPVTVTEGNFR